MDTKAAFEKWLNKQAICKLTGWCEREGDEYAHLQHTALWRAWQSSRAAIECELPRGTSDEIGGYDIDLHATEKAITSHGLNIKK